VREALTGPINLKTGPRKDRNGRELVPSMHAFALRHPWYWERLRWLKKWTITNWAKHYVRAEGPPGTKGNFWQSVVEGEPGECGCTLLSAFAWDEGRIVDGGPVMVCRDHRSLAPGWVYGTDPAESKNAFLDFPEPPIPFTHEHDKRTEVNGLALAEAISSEDVKTGKHHILIDIDRHCVLLPSTSNGHFHLYVQMGTMGDGMDFDDYAEWLRASAKIGLIEEGYAEASIRRRATFLRLPWIRKGHEAEDRERALGWWIDQPEEVSLDGQQLREPDVPF